MAAVDLELGFTDPVKEAARSFRAVLDAMSQPGRLLTWPTTVPGVGGIHAGAMTVALTLLDQDTPYWLAEDLEDPAIRSHLAFHAGASTALTLGEALFVFATPESFPTLVPHLSIGTPEYPDRSATVILAVEALEGGHAVQLSGPGIEGSQAFAPAGVGEAAWAALKGNAGLYPLGFDTVFAARTAVAALPRSTRIDG